MVHSSKYRRNSMPSQQNKTKKNQKPKLCNIGNKWNNETVL